MNHDQIMKLTDKISRELRDSPEPTILSEETEYTADELRMGYVDYFVLQLEAGTSEDDLLDFEDWCQQKMEIGQDEDE